MVSLELIKYYINWWAQMLTALFTHINQLAHIPSDLGLAAIILIYKEGEKSDPANY